jgi:hypothetical protein
MENVGIFCGHLKYFTAIWFILRRFGNVMVLKYIFHRFGTLCQEKSGNPDTHTVCLMRGHYSKLSLDCVGPSS